MNEAGLAAALPPGAHHRPGLGQTGKPVHVQTFVPESPVDALDDGVQRRLVRLVRLVRLDLLVLHPIGVSTFPTTQPQRLVVVHRLGQ